MGESNTMRQYSLCHRLIRHSDVLLSVGGERGRRCSVRDYTLADGSTLNVWADSGVMCSNSGVAQTDAQSARRGDEFI